MSIYTLGVDVGSTASKCIILKDGKEIVLKDVQTAIDNKIAYVPEDRHTYGLVLLNDIKWNMTLASLNGRFSNKQNVIREDDEIYAAEDYKKKINIKAKIRNMEAYLIEMHS